MPAKRILIASLLTALLTAGCASLQESNQRLDADELYHDIQNNLASGNYQSAISRLEALESRFPFGEYAEQAQLDLIYAYYLKGDTDSAVDQVDEFIRENPRSSAADYAYYMKGLAYFDRKAGAFQSLLNTNLASRDPSDARKSFEAFQVLLQKFPNSKYAPDARQRMVYLRDRLAAFELLVAQYYLARQAYVAALHRAQYIVQHYPKTPATRSALQVILKSYKALDLTQLAQDMERVLDANQPVTVASDGNSG